MVNEPNRCSCLAIYQRATLQLNTSGRVVQMHVDTTSACSILVCKWEDNGSCNIGVGIIYVAGDAAYIDGDTIRLVDILLVDARERGQNNKGIKSSATSDVHIMSQWADCYLKVSYFGIYCKASQLFLLLKGIGCPSDALMCRMCWFG